MEGDDGDVDSDFELEADAAPPSSGALLSDYLLVAKLYGHNGLDEAPPEDIEWDRRWVAVYSDGVVWHADDGPSEATGNQPDGLLGRVLLTDVQRCEYTKSGEKMLSLSQAEKCHLMQLDESSTTQLDSWVGAFSQLLAGPGV